MKLALALVDLLHQGVNERSSGGRKAQPARQPVGRLGGAAGAGAVIPIGCEGGSQRLLTLEVTHLNLRDRVVLFPLWHRGEGIDMGLLQRQLAEQIGQLVEGGFNGCHLLPQGGARGKGIHR